MNPLTNMKNQQKMNERELSLGLTGTSRSWHREYEDSAWVYVGGLPYDLTEGDVICIFSQYGEIVNVNLVRDKDTGKSKGFAFLCYEDQRSTILAVDNLNGAKVLGRALRVDHKHDYQVPKEHADEDELTKQLREHGCAPSQATDQPRDAKALDRKKKKKEKKKKKKKKGKSRSHSRSSETVKASTRDRPVSRDVLPSVHVKSEFPEDVGNSGSGKHADVPGHKNDVQVKQEKHKRIEIGSSDSLHQHRRSRSPRRHDKDQSRERFTAVDGRQSTYQNVRVEHKNEDRSRTVKTEGTDRDSGSSWSKRTSRQSDQRDGLEKRRVRSNSSSDSDGHQQRSQTDKKNSRAVEHSRHRQRHKSTECGERKRHGRSTSASSNDDHHSQTDRRETHGDRSSQSDRDHVDRDSSHKHRHHNAR